jgi:hypothetical protein
METTRAGSESLIENQAKSKGLKDYGNGIILDAAISHPFATSLEIYNPGMDSSRPAVTHNLDNHDIGSFILESRFKPWCKMDHNRF